MLSSDARCAGSWTNEIVSERETGRVCQRQTALVAMEGGGRRGERVYCTDTLYIHTLRYSSVPVPYFTYLEVSTHHIISCSVCVESFHTSSSWAGVT